MCRSIKTLRNTEEPVTEDEVRAAALQFVRKVSGYRQPSRANAPAFDRAVDDVTLTAIETCKVVKGVFNKETKKLDAGDAIEGGLKADVFDRAPTKGVRALVITDNDNKIIEIRTGGKKKNQ